MESSVKGMGKGIKNSFKASIFMIHFSLSFFSRKTATARFTVNSLLQFLQEHFYGPIGSRVVTHYPIMGQGRGAHAQPAFFLAGLLFLLARLLECKRGVRWCRSNHPMSWNAGPRRRRLLGTYPLPTTLTWSTYLPGRIARFRRKWPI